MARGNDLPALTSLRFFAAIWVVLFHLAHLPALEPFRTFIERGWMGVPLFFILSGFILAHVYAPAGDNTRPIDTGRFWWARFARVYPLYVLSLVATWPFLSLQGLNPLSPIMLKEQASTLLMLQSWFPGLLNTWNHPAWSLSVEAFFYAVFPLLVVGVFRLCNRISPWMLATGFWGVGSLVQALMAGLSPHVNGRTWDNLLTLFPPWWLPFFLQGIALWYAWQASRAAGVRLSGRVMPAIAALVVLASFPHRLSPVVYGVSSLLMEFDFGVLIVLLAEGGPTWMRYRWMVRLGEASYAMYLFHIPFNDWIGVLLGRAVGQPVASTWVEWIALAAGLVLLCLALHKWIEKPAQRWLRRRGPGTKEGGGVSAASARSS